jgi:hypothetical protein
VEFKDSFPLYYELKHLFGLVINLLIQSSNTKGQKEKVVKQEEYPNKVMVSQYNVCSS